MTKVMNFKDDEALFDDDIALSKEAYEILPASFASEIVVEERQIRQKITAMKVGNEEQYLQACEVGSANAHILRHLEDERKKIVSPLNASVKAINDLFKKIAERFKHNDEKIRRALEEYQKSRKKTKTIQNVQTAEGRATIQERTVYEIIDESKIPREWLMPDTARIGRAVRSGAIKEIPGIKIYKKKTTAFAH